MEDALELQEETLTPEEEVAVEPVAAPVTAEDVARIVAETMQQFMGQQQPAAAPAEPDPYAGMDDYERQQAEFENRILQQAEERAYKRLKQDIAPMAAQSAVSGLTAGMTAQEAGYIQEFASAFDPTVQAQMLADARMQKLLRDAARGAVGMPNPVAPRAERAPAARSAMPNPEQEADFMQWFVNAQAAMPDLTMEEARAFMAGRR